VKVSQAVRDREINKARSHQQIRCEEHERFFGSKKGGGGGGGGGGDRRRN